MKLRCTALGSYVMTAKPSQRDNTDSEVLKFKDFQGPLTSNSKTFKALFHFQGLSRSWKNGKNFQGLSRPCGHPAYCKFTAESAERRISETGQQLAKLQTRAVFSVLFLHLTMYIAMNGLQCYWYRRQQSLTYTYPELLVD